MAQILAIEPDRDRSVILKRLVKESLNIDVVLAESADQAIARLAEAPPDVILTSSLLAPHEDDHVATHLRLSPALDHLPVLTIPPLVEHAAGTPKRSLLSRVLPRLRRRQPNSPTYDFKAVAMRIEDALEESRMSARHNEDDRPARLMLLEAKRTLLLEAGRGPDQSEPISLAQLDTELHPVVYRRDHMARAQRWDDDQLPWLSAVRLTWGADLRLINISRSGLLVESGVRFTLGNRADFELESAEHGLIVRARVVRSDVSQVGSLGVKYIAAAVFERPFQILDPQGSRREAEPSHFSLAIA
jgi:hypothetical protein